MNVQNGSIMWKALADPKRRRIVQLLQAHPLTTGDLCQHFDVSRYAVMKHLKVLEEAGLVETERRGRQRWNYLNTAVAERVAQNGDHEALSKMQVVLESPAPYPVTVASPLTRLSFTLTLEAEITAVFQALTQHTNAWWTLRQWPHSVVKLEGYPGGRLYERFNETEADTEMGTENGLLYGVVTLWQAPRAVKIQGSFGADDVDCTLHLQLRPVGENCHLQLTQQFWRPPTQVSLAIFQQSWAPMLEGQLARLLA